MWHAHRGSWLLVGVTVMALLASLAAVAVIRAAIAPPLKPRPTPTPTAMHTPTPTPTPTAVPVAAFPAAEGYGTDTRGGRGGRVIRVTNLADSGTGSLRAALEASGPRVVVFTIGGMIETAGNIMIDHPYLTVAGQTAPGDGITLVESSSTTKGLVKVRTHDVVIRGMRFRAGEGSGETNQIKNLDIAHSRRIVIDHNSFSWAVDENVTTYDGTHNVTLSWNIVSEGLSHASHYEGEHSRGMLISGSGSRNITAHHNLFAHNMRRNPEMNTAGSSDVRNNVAYNWGTHAVVVSNKYGDHGTNIVGNYFKPGPDTVTGRYEIDGHSVRSGMSLFIKGNVGFRRPYETVADSAMVDPDARRWLVDSPINTAPVTTTTAEQAYRDVLTGAGALAPRRDAIDERILNDVRNGTGSIIDSISEVDGLPPFNGGPAPADADFDGMPDAWETAHGLNPTVDDSARVSSTGYTNIEDYVNGLFGSPKLEEQSPRTG